MSVLTERKGKEERRIKNEEEERIVKRVLELPETLKIIINRSPLYRLPVPKMNGRKGCVVIIDIMPDRHIRIDPRNKKPDRLS